MPVSFVLIFLVFIMFNAQFSILNFQSSIFPYVGVNSSNFTPLRHHTIFS